MHIIRIVDLEVFYRVGVPDEERRDPQRLMLTVELEVEADAAAASDNIADTVDYFAVSQDALHYGEGRSWKLLERLVAELADFIVEKYKPQSVRVEVKKFIIPEARHVSVSCARLRQANSASR